METNTIKAMRVYVLDAFEAAEKTLKSRQETLDTLEKFPGAFEALLKFAEECTPVEDGEFEDWEYALDWCAPDVDKNCGLLTFEIPYSTYFWDVKGQTWKALDDDSDEDEEECGECGSIGDQRPTFTCHICDRKGEDDEVPESE